MNERINPPLGGGPPTDPTASLQQTGALGVVAPKKAIPDYWPSYWPSWDSIWTNQNFDFSQLQLPYNPDNPYMQVTWVGEIGGPWTLTWPEFGGTLTISWDEGVGAWGSTYTPWAGGIPPGRG